MTYLNKDDFTTNHRRYDYSHPLLLLWQGLSAPWRGSGIGKLTNNRSSPISGNDISCCWRIAFLKGIHSAQFATAGTVLTRRVKQRCYGPTWLQEVLLQEDDYDTRGPDREASTVRVLFSWGFLTTDLVWGIDTTHRNETGPDRRQNESRRSGRIICGVRLFSRLSRIPVNYAKDVIKNWKKVTGTCDTNLTATCFFFLLFSWAFDMCIISTDCKSDLLSTSFSPAIAFPGLHVWQQNARFIHFC